MWFQPKPDDSCGVDCDSAFGSSGRRDYRACPARLGQCDLCCGFVLSLLRGRFNRPRSSMPSRELRRRVRVWGEMTSDVCSSIPITMPRVSLAPRWRLSECAASDQKWDCRLIDEPTARTAPLSKCRPEK